MLPGRRWDAELARGHAGARSGLLLCRALGPGAHGGFLHPQNVGAVMSPLCFSGVGSVRGGGFSREARLCSMFQSWEDPGGSRRSDDPSCASDPDWDIFKQGIKIDSG